MWWRTSNCSPLLIYRPWVDERLSWPGRLAYSALLTHISGHPSATGRAQDGERTLARDWRSTTEPHGPTIWNRRSSKCGFWLTPSVTSLSLTASMTSFRCPEQQRNLIVNLRIIMVKVEDTKYLVPSVWSGVDPVYRQYCYPAFDIICRSQADITFHKVCC